MGKKLDHIRGEVAGGGGGGPIQPPYNDRPIKQDIANLKQKDIDLENKIDTNKQKITTLENQQQTTNIAINDIGTRIDNLDRNVAKTNQDNEFAGTQTFEFAKVKRVPGTHTHDVINWGVFNTRATNLENRVTNLEQNPPGGGGPIQPPFDPTDLQQEDLRLQGEIDKTNAKVTTVEQTANSAEQKATANEQAIAQLKQEDLRLQQEIDKTNAKVTTVEQTANNAEQKATDNEQAIADLEQEDTDIKRRLTALENAPPGGGGGGGQPFDPTPLHQEDQRLQGEIDKANQNITGLALSLRNVAMVDQPNRFLEEQVLEKGQVRKVDMKNQHSILNVNTFYSETNLMLVPLTRRVEKLEQRPPGGGGAPPYDDRPVWQKIGQIEADTQTALDTAVKTEQKFTNLENKVDTCAFLAKRNVFTEENTFNNQIIANRVQVSFEGNADNDTVTRKMLKKYNTFHTNNNTTKTLDRYSFAGRDLKYFQYEGLLNFNNNKARIKSNVYRSLNCQIWLSVGGTWYLCPFFNAQGRYSAYVALDQAGTGLEIHSSGLVGGFQSRIAFFFAEA